MRGWAAPSTAGPSPAASLASEVDPGFECPGNQFRGISLARRLALPSQLAPDLLPEALRRGRFAVGHEDPGLDPGSPQPIDHLLRIGVGRNVLELDDLRFHVDIAAVDLDCGRALRQEGPARARRLVACE